MYIYDIYMHIILDFRFNFKIDLVFNIFTDKSVLNCSSMRVTASNKHTNLKIHF